MSDCFDGRQESTHLARLSSTEKQHLDLVLCHLPISLQLALNFIVAWKELFRFETQTNEWLGVTHGPLPPRQRLSTARNPLWLSDDERVTKKVVVCVVKWRGK